jgi:hypothetical protein
MRFKNDCTENTPQKRQFTKCLFSCFAKWVHFKYVWHNRRGGGYGYAYLIFGGLSPIGTNSRRLSVVRYDERL